jgi:peptidoglycan/LPS O-acetylase OafA/YrhL
MVEYWRAVFGRLGWAALETLFIAAVSLAPLLAGRWVYFAKLRPAGQSYWDFLTNGQLAFYSMGSLAALLLVCLRKRLPDLANLVVGAFSVGALIFLMVLVGVDPTLSKGAYELVGRGALYLYIAVLIVRMVTDAMKGISTPDALLAGERVTAKLKSGLAARMGVSADE